MVALPLRLVGLTLAGVVIASTGWAQTPDQDLKPGMTVRATLSDRRAPVVGTLIRAERGQLTLRVGSAEAAFDPRTVVRFERRTVKRYTGTGALVGTALGGAAAVAFAIRFCDDPDTLCEADEYAKIGLVFVAPPALAGALIGSLIRTERWSSVSLAPYLALRDGNGIGLRVRVSF